MNAPPEAESPSFRTDTGAHAGSTSDGTWRWRGVSVTNTQPCVGRLFDPRGRVWSMARPVRFEWDEHAWSGTPHPHEPPEEVRTNPHVACVGSAEPNPHRKNPHALARGGCQRHECEYEGISLLHTRSKSSPNSCHNSIVFDVTERPVSSRNYLSELTPEFAAISR